MKEYVCGDLLFIALLIIVSLQIGCAPKQTEPLRVYPASEPKQSVEEKIILNLELVKHFPLNLEIDGRFLNLIRHVTADDYSYDLSYEMPSTIQVEDQEVITRISLTQPATTLFGGYQSDDGDDLKRPIVFRLEVKNKLSEPIKINWDSVAYVDATGLTHRVIKTGTRYAERDRPTVNIIIPPNARVEEIIFPTDKIHFVSGGEGWKSEEALDGLSTGDRVSIFLPIEVHNSTRNYNFVFQTKKADFDKSLNTSSEKEYPRRCKQGGWLTHNSIKDIWQRVSCPKGTYPDLLNNGQWRCRPLR